MNTHISKALVALLVVVLTAALGGVVQATIITQYSFEDNINDTATGGSTADNLLAYDKGNLPVLSPEYESGIVGKAVHLKTLAGKVAVLEAADSNDLDLGNNWTVEAFVKPDDLDAVDGCNWHRFVLKWWDSAEDAAYAYHLTIGGATDPDQPDMYADGTSSHAFGGTVSVGQWSHIAFTADATPARLKSGLTAPRSLWTTTMAP